jgi:catechol 2,3-dioxygenase-like lactoylglutathione lyase family enzyme
MDSVKPSALGGEKLGAFLACTDAEVARDFYENKLGLTFVSDDQYLLRFDANGSSVTIQKVKEVTPTAYIQLGWHVEDIEASVADLTGRGIKFENYGGDDSGILTFPSGNKYAWFKDPDGNLLSLDQTP